MNEKYLQKIPLFEGLEPAYLSELAGYLQKQSHPPYHTVFWMNERGEHLYIIAKGKVQISYSDDAGKEVLLNTLGAGSFFGELSLIDEGPHTGSARTITDCELLTLDKASFYLFLDKHPQLSTAIMKVLAVRLRNSTSLMQGVLNANEQLHTTQSRSQWFIDQVASLLTSSVFVSLYIVFIVGWIGLQIYLYKKVYHSPIHFIDKPPTFFILQFFITLTSFVLTILILNSQRRQAESDRIRGEIEYQVNLKAQSEIMKLQLKMDSLVDQFNEFSAESSERETGEA